MIFSTIILFILCLRPSQCVTPNSVLYREVMQYHNESASKANFAYEVVNKIYNSFQDCFFTITFCDFTYFENRILKYAENYRQGYPVLLLNGCPEDSKIKVKPKLDRHSRTAYLVTSHELNTDGSEFAIATLKRTGVFKPRNVVIFVIYEQVNIDSYLFHTLKLHFELLWSKSVTNSVIILRSDRLRIYTYNPFFKEIRDLTEAKDLNHILIHQYDNLNGYKLRLSVFRKIYISEDAGPIYCKSKLAVTMMKVLNATCVPLKTRDGNTVGDLLDNGTATGVTADLMDGYADLELNSRILKNSYYGYIDTTYPLKQDNLCFLIKNTEKQATFTTIIDLITVYILMAFLCVVVAYILLAILVRKTEREIWNIGHDQSAGATTMVLMKCFLRQTVDITFWGPVFRFIILIVLMYSLVVNCVIDGIIFSALQNPRFKPNVQTMSELIKTNITFGIHNRDLKLFLNSLNPEQYQAVQNRIEYFNDKRIKEVIENREFQYATLLRQSEAVHISRKLANFRNGRAIFHVMQDCPVPSSVVYGLRYGSPYLLKINHILDLLNQGGILQVWYGPEYYYSLQGKIVTNEKSKKPLNIGTLQEVFFVLFIGLLFSSIIFFLEVSLGSTIKKRLAPATNCYKLCRGNLLVCQTVNKNNIVQTKSKRRFRDQYLR